jgi:tetratricopeptide (TPR) repeat protein
MVAAGVSAPLIGGGVHRITSTVLTSAALVALALFSVGSVLEHRVLRFSKAAWILPLLIAIPILQSIPLPLAVRQIFDPNGVALLKNLIPSASHFPLSLDPPITRVLIGRAALAFAFFIIAYHLASGQAHRYLIPRAVGLAAIVAVTVGIAHQLVGVTKIYGLLTSTHRTLLVGPFVNANHTAELLELGTFACLACAFQRPTMMNRVCWFVGMFLCAGGTAATLSRGGILGLGVGIVSFALLQHFSGEHRARVQRRGRTSLIWGVSLLSFVVLAVAAVGASQLIERFRSADVTGDIRFRVWRDSLRVLAAHPFGIGRGAFDRVYPIYKTVKTPFALRFAFVENESLQLLIDGGWFFYALLVIAAGFLVLAFARQARRDRIEAALVAGLVAVLAHNLVDFGLETPGVLLPFLGILATVLGRARAENPRTPGWGRWSLVAFAAVGCLVGIVATLHSSYDNFDVELRQARTVGEKRQVLIRARAAHPIDYFYTLADAELEPLRAGQGQPSPRFHTLNQALMLCPSCETVHLEVARSLWSLGLRRQGLLEYRSAVELQPTLFRQVVGELFREGARPEELASVATLDSARLIEVARFLGSTGRTSEAATVLSQAQALGAPRNEVLLNQAELQLKLGQTAALESSLKALHDLHVDDPRRDILEARAVLAVSGREGADRALAILDAAAVRHAGDADLQRARVDIVSSYEKWGAAARALEGYKQALYARDGSATEAHLASARILARMGRWTDALGEYRIALADQPTNVGLWMELGGASEAAGRIETAHDAYATAARLSPSNPEASRALQRLADVRREFSEKQAATGL